MEIHIAHANDFNLEKLDYYINYLNMKIERSNKDYGENIKTFGVSLICFSGIELKPLFTYYKGKVTKKLRTFGYYEFEDYMEIQYPLDVKEVSKLLENCSDTEIFSYLIKEILEAIKLLQLKYKKKVPNFKWNELLEDVSILLKYTD